MPARSQAQQEAMGAELARRRAGKRPHFPSMSTTQVEEFAATARAGLPQRTTPRRRRPSPTKTRKTR